MKSPSRNKKKNSSLSSLTHSFLSPVLACSTDHLPPWQGRLLPQAGSSERLPASVASAAARLGAEASTGAAAAPVGQQRAVAGERGVGSSEAWLGAVAAGRRDERGRAESICPSNREREHELAEDPSSPLSSYSCCYNGCAKPSLPLGQRDEAVASREDGRGRRLTVCSRKSQ